MELSPIAAPKFEAGRMSDEGVEINRFKGKELFLNQTRLISSEHLSDVLKKVGVLIWRVFALSQKKRYPLYTIYGSWLSHHLIVLGNILSMTGVDSSPRPACDLP